MRIVCASLLLVCGAAGAAELRNVVVDRSEGRYIMSSEVWFDTDIESIYAVFLDYSYPQQFSGFIVESRNLEPGPGGERRFYIRNHGCIWFYCRSFERSGHVQHEPFVYIRSTADPATSDFHLSLESWRFKTEDGGTLVAYDFEFEPKFWIPPLIGPYVMQQKLQNDSAGAIDRIEALAQAWRR